MSAWEGASVLVTGAAGFIGSHLVQRLLDLGAEVTAFARYNSRNDAGFLGLVGKGRGHLRIVHGDIADLETVRGIVKSGDIVFHLAALVGIPYSYVHPNEVVEVNTIGTLNVLTAARECAPRKVVVTSTSEVYGTARYAPIDETHPKQPQSPYAASKIAADAIALSFHHAFGVPVAVIRPFNTYGPRQSDRAIIPTIIAQALTRDHIAVGNTKPTRDFTFVADTVEAFVAVAERDACIGQEVNVGSGAEITIGEVVQKVLLIVGRELPVLEAEERLRPAQSEVVRLVADASKAKRLTGWQPRGTLDDGLRATVDWIRAHPNLYEPNTYRI